MWQKIQTFFGSKAAQPTTKTSQTKIKIEGMHCSSCAITIDGELEEIPGVFSSRTHYAQGQTTVDYDPEQVEMSQLKKSIEKLGYRVI